MKLKKATASLTKSGVSGKKEKKRSNDKFKNFNNQKDFFLNCNKFHVHSIIFKKEIITQFVTEPRAMRQFYFSIWP